MLQSQRNLHESKNNYERLLAEKSELETKLHHMEERNRENISLVEEYQAKIRVLEETKMSGTSRLKEMEFRMGECEADLRRAQQREKDLTNAMMWENKRHDEESRNLKSALERVSEEVSKKSLERVEKETKLIELEHLVSQLLAINESLVGELGGKKVKVGSTIKKKKKVKSDVIVVPRVASLSTASTDAKHRKVTKSKNIDHLKSVHEMYSSIARTMTGSSGAKKGAGKKTPKETSMKKRLTKVKNLSNKLASASVSDTNGVYKLKVDIPSVNKSLDKFDAKFGDLVSEEQLALEKDEMQEVINSLEEEFDDLNEQYRRLLSSKDTGDDGTSSEELVSVIQKMHKKGEQLRALKSPSKRKA